MIHANWVGKIVIDMEIPDGIFTIKESEQAFHEEMSKVIEEILMDELDVRVNVNVTKLEATVEEIEKSS